MQLRLETISKGALGVLDNLEVPIPTAKISDLAEAFENEHRRAGQPGPFWLEPDAAAEAWPKDFDINLRSIRDRFAIDSTSMLFWFDTALKRHQCFHKLTSFWHENDINDSDVLAEIPNQKTKKYIFGLVVWIFALI